MLMRWRFLFSGLGGIRVPRLGVWLRRRGDGCRRGWVGIRFWVRVGVDWGAVKEHRVRCVVLARNCWNDGRG